MGSPPLFANSYTPATGYGNGPSPQTCSVTVDADDVLIVCGVVSTWINSSYTIATPTGGGLTYTLEQSIQLTNSYCAVYVWSAIGTSTQTFTLSATQTNNLTKWSYTALRFYGSDGVGASAKTNISSGAPLLALDTLNDNSSVVVVNGDWSCQDGASRTWRTVNSFTPTAGNSAERAYFRNTNDYAVYVGYYDDVGPAGSNNFGLSAPGTQTYAIVALEVKGTGGADTGLGATKPYRPASWHARR